MKKKFEKTLSFLIDLSIILMFLAGILERFTNLSGEFLTGLFDYSFLASRLLMLVFAIHVLFQRDSFAFSIVTALVSALAFCLLLNFGLVILSARLGYNLVIDINSNFFRENSQIILYTAIIVVYFFQLVNHVKLSKIKEASEEDALSEEKIGEEDA